LGPNLTAQAVRGNFSDWILDYWKHLFQMLPAFGTGALETLLLKCPIMVVILGNSKRRRFFSGFKFLT